MRRGLHHDAPATDESESSDAGLLRRLAIFWASVAAATCDAARVTSPAVSRDRVLGTHTLGDAYLELVTVVDDSQAARTAFGRMGPFVATFNR